MLTRRSSRYIFILPYNPMPLLIDGQIARGMQLPLTIVIASIQSRSVPRRAILTAAAIVSGGFFYGVSPSSFYVSRGTSSATITSLVYGFLSSFMIALHAVLIKPAHAVVDGSVIQLTYWTNLGSAIAIVRKCLAFPLVFLLKGECVGAFHYPKRRSGGYNGTKSARRPRLANVPRR